MISVEIISVSFDASFEDLICSWEKKTFTTEMMISGNARKSFSSRKCPATSQKCTKHPFIASIHTHVIISADYYHNHDRTGCSSF